MKLKDCIQVLEKETNEEWWITHKGFNIDIKKEHLNSEDWCLTKIVTDPSEKALFKKVYCMLSGEEYVPDLRIVKETAE